MKTLTRYLWWAALGLTLGGIGTSWSVIILAPSWTVRGVGIAMLVFAAHLFYGVAKRDPVGLFR